MSVKSGPIIPLREGGSGSQQPFPFVYEFNSRRVDGDSSMREILGGKGSGLAGMCRIGLPVPPGFTITTQASRLFNQDPERFQLEVCPEVDEAIRRLEKVTGREFNSHQNPLLLSVRSGAKFSMPGMMDTILNIGLNDRTVEALIQAPEDHFFAYDCYRRLFEMFGEIVFEIPRQKLESPAPLGDAKKLEIRCSELKAIIACEGKNFPQDVREQLRLAVLAVFRSWNNPRAVTYRRLHDIPEDAETAVIVQMMVFGNRGKYSGTGVGFTRNPSTGERCLFGEFLFQAQGEDVVAGTRTPLGLDEVERALPEVYEQIEGAAELLERHYRDMQDFEFTVEDGKLYMLQTRTGKRTGPAAARIAWEMYREGVISREEALLRVEPEQLEQFLHPVFKEVPVTVIGRGLPASPGAAVGGIVFSVEDAVGREASGESVILVRNETVPDDIHGMGAAQGILTARGGMTSHAAVVARGMGKCCVVGCDALRIDEENETLCVGDWVLRAGDFVSIDGNDGRVMLGQVERVEPDLETGLFAQYMSLLNGQEGLLVRANADTPRDARIARGFGAAGVGLCRTEHMFFAPDRLPVIQELIVVQNPDERHQLLERLKAFQKEDFLALLEVMDGLPVTVRLLDPPLHEFLPKREPLRLEIEDLRRAGASTERIAIKERLLRRTEELQETNPMLGHRGCRLGISFPEITRFQVTALLEAACELRKQGRSPIVEVMIPFVSLVEEFRHQEKLIRAVAQEVFKNYEMTLSYTVGTMIEVPRAALVADEIARYAEFFSFGTNDLTQTTFGFSRDDAVRFLKRYQDEGILAVDPFRTLDRQGVGELVRIAVTKGKKVRADLKCGICGEQGGDPLTIRFCLEQQLDYVSCSPYRIPVARLAAAQATLRLKRNVQSDERGTLKSVEEV